MRTRLAIVVTHPIQYYAPLYRLLARRGVLDIHVFYGWEGSANAAAPDPGFGRRVKWDIPLLGGYDHTFVHNDSSKPGTGHFLGISSRELLSSVTAWNPDVLLVYGWKYHSHLQIMRRMHGRLPIMFRGDSTLLGSKAGIQRWARHRVLSWVYRHVDLALYVGQHNRAYFAAHGLEDERLAWAPHSVENDRFQDPHGSFRRQANAWRQDLGIADDETVALFVGKLEPVKAPDLLLAAFMARAQPRAHLIMAGTGPLEATLRRRAKGNRHVHFIGFQNQSRMPVVYRLGDFFVLPSRSETWGLAVNEAMASGLPAIVSNRVGCAPDLVESGKTGSVFRHDDVGALTKLLTEYFGDATLRATLSAGAEERIGKWSLEEQATRLEEATMSTRALADARRK
jgi:glycosyltransferase involved in cell wall biosynthesis